MNTEHRENMLGMAHSRRKTIAFVSNQNVLGSDFGLHVRWFFKRDPLGTPHVFHHCPISGMRVMSRTQANMEELRYSGICNTTALRYKFKCCHCGGFHIKKD